MADFMTFSTNQIATKIEQIGNCTNGKNGVSGPTVLLLSLIILDCSLMKIPLMNKYRERDKNLQKHEMSFTYEALVCLGKQTAFIFPLD